MNTFSKELSGVEMIEIKAVILIAKHAIQKTDMAEDVKTHFEQLCEEMTEELNSKISFDDNEKYLYNEIGSKRIESIISVLCK